MKTISISIIKKNRKYFACLHNGFDVKLVIDPTSENLTIGKHDILVDDVSIRTKYGTDVIFKMIGETKKTDKIVTLKSHVYNDLLVASCRNLGGKWDTEAATWVFSSLVEQEVDDLDRLFNEDLIIINIESLTDISSSRCPVYFLGYTIARAFGRDSGAKLADKVIMLDGNISSGGSVKNWFTKISEGSKFRLQVSKNLLNKYEIPENWKVEIAK